MKKLFTLFALILVSIAANAQIKQQEKSETIGSYRMGIIKLTENNGQYAIKGQTKQFVDTRLVVDLGNEEAIRVVDRISLEIEEAEKDHYSTYKSIGNSILKCGNMRVLKKEYPEAYKVLEAYDTESPKSKANTALQLPLESINKILSKYEKDN